MKNQGWQVHDGKCDYCHSVIFDDSLAKAAHTRLHKKLLKAEAELGYLPAHYHDRESAKRKASSVLIGKVATQEEKMQAAMIWLRCYFDRSLYAAILRNYWKEHPRFEEYLAMFEPPSDVIPANLMTKIREQYGRIDGEIPNGDSDWYPPRSKDRRLQFKQRQKAVVRG